MLNAWKVQEEYKKKRKLGEGGDDSGVSRKNSKRQKLEAEKESEGRGGKKVDMRIQPGESLAHFNRYVEQVLCGLRLMLTVHVCRRVEDSLRSLVRDAMQTSAATERKARKEEELEKTNKKKAASSNKVESKESDEGPTKSTNPSSKPQTSHIADEDEHHRPETQSHKAKKNVPTEFTSFSASAPRRLNDIVQAPPELKKLPRGAKPRQAAQSGTGTKSLKEGVLSMAQKVMLEGERERVIKAYRELKKRNAGE